MWKHKRGSVELHWSRGMHILLGTKKKETWDLPSGKPKASFNSEVQI